MADSPSAFTLTSPAFQDGGTLPQAHVHDSAGGANRSPALQWSGAPAGTAAFAVTAYDPDAPTGSGWWHWVAYNLPADATGLPEGAGSAGGSLPAGARHGRTDFGTEGYGGAAPPPGDAPHRYTFTVYALKEKIDVPADATAAAIGFNLHFATLAKASVTARYGR